MWYVVIYPQMEYYLMIEGHNWFIVPAESPIWLLNRIDNMFRWYYSGAHPDATGG